MAASARAAHRERLPNALFVHASLEKLPDDLHGIADGVTVLFPWGSLLRGVANPEPHALCAFARLARPGANLDVLLNASVFEDEAYCARLGLAVPVRATHADALSRAYVASHIRMTRHELVEELPFVTTWGRALTRGTRRQVLRISGRFGDR